MNDTNNFEKTILPIIFVNRAHWLGKIIYIYIYTRIFRSFFNFIAFRIIETSNYLELYDCNFDLHFEYFGNEGKKYIFSIIFANYTARQSLLEGIIFSPSCLSFHFASIIISLSAILINSTSVSTTSIEIKIIKVFY